MDKFLIFLLAVVSFAFSCNSSKNTTETVNSNQSAVNKTTETVNTNQSTINNSTEPVNTTQSSSNNTTGHVVQTKEVKEVVEEVEEKIEKVKNTTQNNTTHNNQNTTQSTNTSNHSTNNPLVGEYIWVKTVCCGRLRNVTTPESKNEVVKLEFKPNGKMVKTTNNARAAERTYTYMPSGTIYPDRPQLKIEGKHQDALVRYEDGLLVLDYQYMDLQLEYYKKIN